MQHAREVMLASFIEDLPIIDFEPLVKKIILSNYPKSTLYSLKDLQANLKKNTGDTWVVEVVSSTEKEGKSINQEKIEELEKRKKAAIDSPVIKSLMETFTGAEIVKVEEI